MSRPYWLVVFLFFSGTSFAANPTIQLTKYVVPLDIKFGEGKAVLKRGPHNTPELKRLEQELKQYPFVHVEIEGNPDPAGPEKLNQALSRRRAEALRDAFADLYGIPGGRMQIHAAGETRAAVELKTAAAPAGSHPVYVILYRLQAPAR